MPTVKKNVKEKQSINKKEMDKNSFLVTNSKISTDIFMNALNYKNNNNFDKIQQKNQIFNQKKNEKINNISMKPLVNSESNSISPKKYDLRKLKLIQEVKIKRSKKW